jgi:chitinase
MRAHGLATIRATRTWLALFLGFLFLTGQVRAGLWVTGYYPGYEQAGLPPSAIDFSVVTHVIQFSVLPNSNGTVSRANGLTAAYSVSLVSRAHSLARKALLCVGGAGSEAAFQAASAAPTRSTFISNLTNFLAAYDYDGVDLDWEPLPASDFALFTNLVLELRTALNGFATPKLLTVAAGAFPNYGDPPDSEAAMYAALQGQLDQINLMTYDLSGPWPGWVTWFNSPLYDGGYRFPSTGRLVPSADGAVSRFLANGVAAAKLGLGLPFYGYVWSGGSGTTTGGAALPRQSWSSAPSTSAMAYARIMAAYYQSNLYHWDPDAQAAYLTVDQDGAANDKFISYDDHHACQAKVSYARNHFLGGLMIWELGQDDAADPLTAELKRDLATPGALAIQRSKNDITLTFNSLPLSLYRLSWTTNLASGTWQTLTSNIPGGPDGLTLLYITDPGALDLAPERFYRVQTPP